MPDTPQWLIFLISQQDYGWFLGAVLWGGVATAAWRLPQLAVDRRIQYGWMAASQLAYCLVELIATAVPDRPPHRELDAIQGWLVALGYAGLVWPKVWPDTRTLRRVAVLLAPALLASPWRPHDPIYGGLVWSLWGVAVCVASIEWRPQLKRAPLDETGLMGLCLLAALVVSPLGPLAYALLAGRRDADLSPFIAPHLVALLAAPVFGFAALWRASMAGREEWRRALRAAWGSLLVWLVVGFGLILWTGARTRARHNERLSRQTENAALMIDRTSLREALGPGFVILKTYTFYQPEGWPVKVAHVPFAMSPPFGRLTDQLHQIELVNPDADFIHILAVHDGLLVAPAIHVANQTDRYLIGLRGEATDADRKMLREHHTVVLGPMMSSWGPIVSVRTPLFDGGANTALGWLVIQYRVAIWQAEQAVDRFVIMGLVALGIVLWGLAVAYRLRNFEREAALRQVGAAAEADRVKTLFLAKVSHELRTPLQTILGNAELALRANPPPAVATRIAAMRSQGALLQRLVNDLLDLSAVQTGRFQLRTSTFNLSLLAAESLEALAGSAREKGLALKLECPGDLPLLMGDAHRLRQILLNLLGNAVKYTERGGVELILGAEGLGPNRHLVRIAIVDTGPGIAPEDQARLFEPFTRLDQHRHLADGTGLGLSLVAGLVRAMGGTIGLHSDGVQGTRVTCEIPLAEGCRTERVCSIEAMAAPPPARVLVADDNTLVREVLTSWLGETGFDVVAVSDGEEAVAAFGRTRFDAVLLDISMPRLNGIETARKIRQLSAGGPSPWIIGLSAHAQEADIALAQSAGMDRFLVKPVELAMLDEVLAEGLAGRTPVGLAVIATDLKRQLEATFAEEWPALRARLRSALATENWPAFREAVHYLKNSADVLGLDALRLACMEAEHAAGLQDSRQAERIWLRIEQLVT